MSVEKLHANGYLADIINFGGAPGPAVIASQLQFWWDNGVAKRMRDELVSLAVVYFDFPDASPLASRFADEFVKVVRKACRGQPLVRIAPASVHIIFQSSAARIAITDSTTQRRPLFAHGLRFADAQEYAKSATLAAGTPSVAVDGEWLDGRSPLTVRREDLPSWTGSLSDALSADLRALVEQWVAAGDVEINGGYVPPTPVVRDGQDPRLAAVGLEQVPRTPDPPPIRYADPRVEHAFGAMRRLLRLGG